MFHATGYDRLQVKTKLRKRIFGNRRNIHDWLQRYRSYAFAITGLTDAWDHSLSCSKVEKFERKGLFLNVCQIFYWARSICINISFSPQDTTMIASIMKVGSTSAVIGMSLFIAAPCLLHLRRISGLQRSSFTTSAGSTKTNEFQYTKDNVQVLVDKMEELVQVDEGRRGIKEIILPAGELYNAALDLANAHTVVIITGFPCLLNNTPPTETDGPLGALAIAKCLLLLGKDVIVATDECNEEVVLACAAASAHKNKLPGGTKVGTLTLESFPGGNAFNAKEEARMLSLSHRADMVVAIERMGPCADGRYLTMRGFDMTALAAPLEELLKPSVAVFTANDGEDAVQLVNGRKPRSIGIGNNSSIFPLFVFVPFYIVLYM
jgi:hypothetical protein